ncbi:hypothetical protein Tco_0648780 [Tanacetum coccineum]
MIFSLILSRAPSVDPILISVQVYRRKVGRVLLDGGASCNIIYEHYFLKLRKEVRERRKDIHTTLSRFSDEQVIPLGEISLQITIGEAPHHMLYQSEIGPRVIMSEYQDIRRCKQIKRLNESFPEASIMVSGCVNPEEKVVVNQKYPKQIVTIGRQLPTQFKQKLVKLLRDNGDIFVWEYSDMTGIPRLHMIGNEIFITEDKKITHVQQKKIGMAPERCAATSKEVEELRKAGIIRETR